MAQSVPPARIQTQPTRLWRTAPPSYGSLTHFGAQDTNNTIEWTNTPDGAAKQFRREWFQGDGMVRRKNLPVEYNS